MQDILTDANISMPIRSHLPSSPQMVVKMRINSKGRKSHDTDLLNMYVKQHLQCKLWRNHYSSLVADAAAVNSTVALRRSCCQQYCSSQTQLLSIVLQLLDAAAANVSSQTQLLSMCQLLEAAAVNMSSQKQLLSLGALRRSCSQCELLDASAGNVSSQKQLLSMGALRRSCWQCEL